MIVFLRSKYSLDDFLLWGRWIALSGVVLVIAIFGFKNPGEVALNQKTRFGERTLDFEKMLSGPLALRENSKSPLVLSLENKLVLLAQSARPDLPRKDRCFCIGVKGEDSQKVVREGEAIFIGLTKHSSGGVEEILFVEEGPTRMVPHVLDSQSLLLTLEGFEEQGEVFLKAGGDQSIGEGLDSGVGALKQAKWYGEDVFFKMYGGSEYGALGQKEKLEVSTDADSYVLYIREKGYLTFTEGRWREISSLEEADKNAPLAQVQKISSEEVEIEGWDAEGFVLFYSKLPKARSTPLQISLEQVIFEPILRNESQVSCRIGKKHCQVEAGDWFLRKKDTWQKLNKLEDIEAFLTHKLCGELLVIDEIEDRGVIKGNFFDETRTQTMPALHRARSSLVHRKLRNR